MPIHTIVGIFGDLGAAERARAELMEAGIARHRIALSANLTDDGIAAEAPGQSYENQYWSSDEDDTRRARFNAEVQSAACVVSVASEPRDRERIAELLRREGARRTLLRPR
jgi:hypothetical protein